MRRSNTNKISFLRSLCSRSPPFFSHSENFLRALLSVLHSNRTSTKVSNFATSPPRDRWELDDLTEPRRSLQLRHALCESVRRLGDGLLAQASIFSGNVNTLAVAATVQEIQSPIVMWCCTIDDCLQIISTTTGWELLILQTWSK